MALLIYNFPDELVSNDTKLTKEYGREYALAMWNEWSSNYHTRSLRLKNYKDYADSKQSIETCKNNLKGKLILDKHINVNWKDRKPFFAMLKRNFYNSVDMSEFAPVVRAIDVHAAKVKNARKEQKLKNFYAKDFIQQTAELGNPIVPLDEIPDSKEQIDLEEETANPLKKEIAEELVLSAIARDNYFDMIKEMALQDGLEQELYALRVDTDPIEGIKLNYIKHKNFIHGKTSNKHFTDCRYFGEVKHITVGQLKNIAKRSGTKITDEDIRELLSLNKEEKVTNKLLVKVLFYAFETHFTDVIKKKINRNTNEVRLVDRTKDVGTDKEYNPKMSSDKSEKITDTYPVWLEGVMILDGDKNQVLQHGKVFSMPEHKGKILSPFIVCKPREICFMEEVIPQIDSIDLLRYKIIHMRNTLKGNITRLDPDSLADVTLAGEKQDPKDILSLYFSQYIAFDKSTDDYGDPLYNKRTPVSEVPSVIPYALRELTTQYIQEIQFLQQTFGAFQLDQAKPDPETQGQFELYRNSDNTGMRDYTKSLYTWIVRVFQVISSRLNDIDSFPDLLEKYSSELDTEDEDVKTFFREERAKSRFEVYEDMIMTKEEKAEFAQLLNLHVQSGLLDALDVRILKQIKNPKVAAAKLRLMLMTKQKQQQDFELQKQSQNQNQNIEAVKASYEKDAKLSEQDHIQRLERERIEFEHRMLELQKQGEIKILESNNSRDTKFQLEEFRKKFESDLTAFKKEQDAKNRQDAINLSYDKQQQLVKLKKGEIDDINEDSSAPQIDLTTLNQ